MPVPIALVAPVAAAGLAYINAKAQISYDYRLLSSLLKGQFKLDLREKRDRLNIFYDLENHALGKLGSHPFLIFEGRTWSYKETYDIALKYGSWLKEEHGIRSKDIVAIDFLNGEHFIFIWFGLWSIGAKPAFINYNLTGKALTHCLKVAKTSLVLVDPNIEGIVTLGVRESLPETRFQVFTKDVESRVMATIGTREPDSSRTENQARNLAMLIYTSGTTGLPKPAIVSWTKFTVGSMHASTWINFSSRETFYTCMPLYHSSAAVLGVGSTIAAGGTIAVGRKFSTKTFWNDVRASKATIIQYVGETCRYLLSAAPQVDPVSGENLDRKHNVQLAFGNGLRPEIWNQFKERFGIGAIAEFYAATEGAGGSFNLSKNDFSKGAIGRNGWLGSLVLGRNTALVELDWDTEQPWRDPKSGLCKAVPVGQPGEALYQLDPNDIKKKFQGYFGNPSSTNSKIIHNVLKKGDAWLRTGDMLIGDSEGRTYFSDRIGDTFRWKSENVSTNEVAGCLGDHPVVQEVNVYGVELPNHDGRAGCVAIILTESPSSRVLSSLAQHVQKNLPKFAVPLFLRLTTEMQRTGTNKQQKHVVRLEGVDPSKVGDDDLFWLQDGTYVKFGTNDWNALKGGSVKL